MLPVVQEAGNAVLKFFRERDFTVAHKDAENPVTEADFAANHILLTALKNFYAQDSILSEEADSEEERAMREKKRRSAKRVWVIDPIDGTRDFIHGVPEFAVSVGLVENKKPVLGFVLNPAQNYLLSGGPSLGLFLNGARFERKARPNKTPPHLAISRTEFKKGDLEHLKPHYANLKNSIVGSIAYKLALCADGTVDLVVSVRPKNEWDLAGGAALIAAAGLTLRDGNNDTIEFNKEKTETWGLIAGTEEACAWYLGITK